MTTKLIITALLLVLATPLGGFAQSSGNNLVGLTWRLLRYGEIANPTVPVARSRTTPTVTFAANGELSAFLGCDFIQGPYALAGDRLTLDAGKVVTTTTACGEALDLQDRALREGLQTPSARVVLEGGQLNIFYADGKKALVFERAPN